MWAERWTIFHRKISTCLDLYKSFESNYISHNESKKSLLCAYPVLFKYCVNSPNLKINLLYDFHLLSTVLSFHEMQNLCYIFIGVTAFYFNFSNRSPFLFSIFVIVYCSESLSMKFHSFVAPFSPVFTVPTLVSLRFLEYFLVFGHSRPRVLWDTRSHTGIIDFF